MGGCSGLLENGDEPSIEMRDSALLDSTLSPVVTGVDPGTEVELRTTVDGDVTEWMSSATFEADGNGRIDLTEQEPIAGAYDRADPMGLLWTLEPETAAAGREFSIEQPFDVMLTAIIDGDLADRTTTERRPADPEVSIEAVETEAVSGKLFVPPGENGGNAVVLLHGSDGELPESEAKLLASRGHVVLTPRYWAGRLVAEQADLPDRPAEIPVETVQRAIDWLLEDPRVAGTSVGLKGTSLGGSLALLAATEINTVDPVISDVGSAVVFEGHDQSAQQFEG